MEMLVPIALEMPTDMMKLAERAKQVEDLVTPPRSVDEHGQHADNRRSRGERRAAWFARLEDAVLDLSNTMPQGTEDYDVRRLLGFVVDLRRAIEADADVRDATGEVELSTMRMADVVVRVRRRLLHERLDDPQAAVSFVLSTLGGVGASEVAALLGVSTKTIGAWRHGSRVRHNLRRVVLVAQVLSYLQTSMTARGIVMWFDAERDQLAGRTPLELIQEDEASAHAALIQLARTTRGQLAD